MTAMNIWVVEDDSGYRRTLQRLLNRDQDISCPQVFASCQPLFDTLSAESHPDLILMDLGLPGMSGVEGIQKLAELAPNIVVVVLTVFSAKEKVMDALDAGAAGYLLKSATPREIIRGLKGASEGGVPLSPAIAKTVLEEMNSSPSPEDFDLSERELEVLQLLAEGLANKQIAERLNISPFTVNFHFRNLYKKLQVQSQPAAVAKAFRAGLLS
ncbi:response regulator transcription factor [Roseibacillus persicicus]|uniref:DNA-binding response regulator n=1 Tax=Roseibacillus persicicus TaxID=454148 RepID=A0A918TJE4_9BACT|nr:response regulator transcription factor [Roseibacillus persicicus]GHC48687.1 DNA-binding response regulator [Roseibacillus persicicus]